MTRDVGDETVFKNEEDEVKKHWKAERGGVGDQ
jgi:hypothetical protein